MDDFPGVSVEDSEFSETVIRLAEHDSADRLFLFALATHRQPGVFLQMRKM